MLQQRHRPWMMTALALLMLGLTIPAGARGPGRGGPGAAGLPGPGPEGGFAGGVLEQLISPCRAGCLATARDCRDAAETSVLSCVQDVCATEITTAQSACATDRTSQSCQDAVSALRTCAQTCLETFHDAVTACRDALGVCRDTCDTTQ